MYHKHCTQICTVHTCLNEVVDWLTRLRFERGRDMYNRCFVSEKLPDITTISC